jgi:hypothetical protein
MIFVLKETKTLKIRASGAFDFIYGLPMYLIYCIFYSAMNGEQMRHGVDIFNNKHKNSSWCFKLDVNVALIWLQVAGPHANQLIM